jgi:hypothetical protein
VLCTTKTNPLTTEVIKDIFNAWPQGEAHQHVSSKNTIMFKKVYFLMDVASLASGSVLTNSTQKEER